MKVNALISNETIICIDLIGHDGGHGATDLMVLLGFSIGTKQNEQESAE